MWCLPKVFQIGVAKMFQGGVANIFECDVCKGVSDWYLQRFSYFEKYLKLKSEKHLKLKSENHLKSIRRNHSCVTIETLGFQLALK